MSKHNPNGFIYHLCAITGWVIIIIGLGAVFFQTIASGDMKGKMTSILISLIVVGVGILIVRIVEKNIFKAFEKAFDYIFTVFW